MSPKKLIGIYRPFYPREHDCISCIRCERCGELLESVLEEGTLIFLVQEVEGGDMRFRHYHLECAPEEEAELVRESLGEFMERVPPKR